MGINSYEVIVTDIAREELEEIYDYIFNNLCNRIAANNLMNKIEQEIFSLEKNPYKYVEVHIKHNNEVYRELPVDNYVVLYDIDEEYKQVIVYRAIYGKRNYLKIIEE